MMASRRLPVKAFAPPQRNLPSDRSEDLHSTDRKSVWTPPPSVQTLVNKVEQVEQRLEHLETLIGHQLDPEVKRHEQEEVEQSRAELQEMRSRLDAAVLRLQQREVELQNTQDKLDNLSNQSAADRGKIHKLELERKELQQLVQDLETKLNERVKKITRLEKQLAEMQRSLNNTNQQVAAMQAQMEQLHHQMVAIAAAATPRGETDRHYGNHFAELAEPQVARSPQPGQTSPRQQNGALGLPPIALTSQPAKSRGGTMNFPPIKK